MLCCAVLCCLLSNTLFEKNCYHVILALISWVKLRGLDSFIMLQKKEMSI